MANLKISALPEYTGDVDPDTDDIAMAIGGITYKVKRWRLDSKQRTLNTATPTAILMDDGILLFDTTSTAITIDLPLANVGKIRIPFKDIGANSATNNITFNRVGSDTIVDSATGQTSTIIASNGYSGQLVSNGVDTWYLM
jgi:hypothetical protein